MAHLQPTAPPDAPGSASPGGPAIDLAGHHHAPGWDRLALTIRPARRPAALDALRDELDAACRFMGLAGNREFGVAGHWAEGTRTIRFAVTAPALTVAAPARLRDALTRIARNHCGDTSRVAFDAPPLLFEFFVTVTDADGDEWVERALAETPARALAAARRQPRPAGTTVAAIDPEPARIVVDGAAHRLDSLAAALLATALIAAREAHQPPPAHHEEAA